MADKYQINRESKMVKNQIEDVTDSINKHTEGNRFTKIHSIIKSITNSTMNFFLNLGKPLFKIKDITKIPSSSEFNDSAELIHKDLGNAYMELKTLKHVLKSTFNFSRISEYQLFKTLEEIQRQSEDLSLYLSSESDSFLMSCRDNFNSLNNIDKDETNVDINLYGGNITLSTQEFENLNTSGAEVEILDSSNGDLGNTHEVVVTNSSNRLDENNIKFIGEENTHSEISEIQDDNPSTWFEYELCNLPHEIKMDPIKYLDIDFLRSPGTSLHQNKDINKKIREMLKDRVFTVSDLISDLIKTDYEENDVEHSISSIPLKLDIKIKLQKSKSINWIDIEPFIPTEGGEVLISSIKISEEDNGEQIEVVNNVTLHSDINKKSSETFNPDAILLSKNEDLSGRGIFNFKPMIAKEIIISLEQHNPYQTKIGHIYYERTITKQSKKRRWFGLTSSTETESETFRISAPDGVESEAGGVSGRNILGWGTTTTTIGDDIQAKREAHGGVRWSIGIRNLNINSFRYQEKNILVSRNFNSPVPIRKVKLNAIETIPKNFYQGLSAQTLYSNKYKWIKYYISTDDGASWNRISPHNRSMTNHNKTYFINTHYDLSEHGDEVGFLQSSSDVYNIKVKIELTRPTDIQHASSFTPIVDGYELLIMNEEE